MSGGSSSKAMSVQETWEGRYEQLMEQFASDMCLYMRMVCDTIVTTVPKSVVHCLVRKAEKNLLNHLFGYVHKMSPEELQRMLQVSEEEGPLGWVGDRLLGGGGSESAAAISNLNTTSPLLNTHTHTHTNTHAGGRQRGAQARGGA